MRTIKECTFLEPALEVRPGDVVVMGSDGLFDNLHDEEVAACLEQDLLGSRGMGDSPVLAPKPFPGSGLNSTSPAVGPKAFLGTGSNSRSSMMEPEP